METDLKKTIYDDMDNQLKHIYNENAEPSVRDDAKKRYDNDLKLLHDIQQNEETDIRNKKMKAELNSEKKKNEFLERELDIKEKEIETKNKEIDLKEKELSSEKNKNVIEYLKIGTTLFGIVVTGTITISQLVLAKKAAERQLIMEYADMGRTPSTVKDIAKTLSNIKIKL
jgi:hypothetical protein